MTTPDPNHAPKPAGPAPDVPVGPSKDAVWRTFGGAPPAVGALVYVRGDRDFDPRVPYKFGPNYRGAPGLRVERSGPNAAGVWEGAFLKPGDEVAFRVLDDALWTPAEVVPHPPTAREALEAVLARLEADYKERESGGHETLLLAGFDCAVDVVRDALEAL